MQQCLRALVSCSGYSQCCIDLEIDHRINSDNFDMTILLIDKHGFSFHAFISVRFLALEAPTLLADMFAPKKELFYTLRLLLFAVRNVQKIA